MQQMRTPKKQGLYDPQFEHDACGIAMLVNIKGKKTHTIVADALTALERMNHRGGRSEDQKIGDGAGVMTELPHELFKQEWKHRGKQLPQPGQYGVGMLFLPNEPHVRQLCEDIIVSAINEEKLQLFGWRTVPTNDSVLNTQFKETRPCIRQAFITSVVTSEEENQFERTLYQLRRRIEREIKQHLSTETAETFYVPSLSSRTIVYKGLLLPEQLKAFYSDLNHEGYKSAMALVHNRFSTNTFPIWRRAQPNRFSLHNGEINTINGNVNWMLAREGSFHSKLLPELDQLCPVIDPEGSDSAMFDNVLEFLVMSGWSLPHAMMMMIPEPWHNIDTMDKNKRAFYQYHSSLMEPWDGPAAMVYTDGHQVGACLDRNGLRPVRFVVTNDDFIYLSSEVGVVDVPEETIVRKDSLRPGQMLLVDIREGLLLLDNEIKKQIINAKPYQQWVQQYVTNLRDLKTDVPEQCANVETEASLENQEPLRRLQQIFGFTYEEWNKVLKPMAVEGHEPIRSMGYDAPLAVLSDRPQLLFNYFKQKFAQVTNPPIDAIREELVTSVEVLLGPEGNLLEPRPKEYKKIRLQSPILSKFEMKRLRLLNSTDWKTTTVPIVYPQQGMESEMENVLHALLQTVDQEVEQGCNILILSDMGVHQQVAAIPSLLAVSAVHHHLIRTGRRSKVSLIVESGEPREVHHFAALLGYGANAVYPYLVYASLPALVREEGTELSIEELYRNYVISVNKGILKVMSKMGISTLQSYIGSKIFEAVGISAEVIEQFFPGTSSQIGGLSLEDIARESLSRHMKAYTANSESLDSGSDLQWRHDGEAHLYRPETIHTLQQACRTNDYGLYKKYSQMLQDEMDTQITLRGLLKLNPSDAPISIEEVESIQSIVRRFKTGAMSYGSISQEAHEAIAIAMNRIGAKSNSGEGGEDPERFTPMPNGDSKCSAIKQIASGRFGVTSHYLVNSDEIQIKMAQGAKPGEGGQLAGHKVTPSVARTRGSTPGIELISPPPHHDIYSIEDLAQLIYDLKNANPQARINVKLVAEAGVGTIAAGVAKAKADVILISGFDGGTGAAPRTSIKHAGMPWELGLAEAHQALMLNGLRNRVRLETDGKLMNGRDVVIAALLGAEEYGFSTLPLVTLGCVMMRVCHLDTCPVGIATQNPELRKKMMGKPEHIVNLMFFIAREIREYMAQLGFRTMDEMIGRTDMLTVSDNANWKTQKLDMAALLHQVKGPRVFGQEQDHELDQTLDYRELLQIGRKAWENQEQVYGDLPICNMDRAVGTLLGSEITRHCGIEGLPHHSINIRFQGSAGQSFGAFIPNGMTLMLEGDANDAVGKGLSGGKIAIYPAARAKYAAESNTIIGNAAFYGATSGEAFIRGKAGERFCVRNSGATVVVEGIGDHGCEYMTGGTAIILGEVGKNFAAGMSGGIAYILETPSGSLRDRCNHELVLIEALQEQDEAEKNYVKMLIEQHLQYTGSKVAERLLEQWEQGAIAQFVRVIPKEYKRLLQSTNHFKPLLFSS
ncbi:glutamate synthase large subunit [Pueribacillus theae]|uniref:Glutamate synthase large subunit n=1 Tax=Pueribacillus theae TaxID=2171751 RepID=A0A2U1K7A6_9BACI|nr:glutamate synthase large subunit [Pueribacillus theae]PWA13145.1 glutamate synthase large subunit [Pueribacillus theae]